MRITSPVVVLAQTLGWAAAWVLITLAVSTGLPHWPRLGSRLLPQVVGLAVVVVINVGFLLPTLYFRERKAWYFAGTVLLVAVPLALFYYGWSRPGPIAGEFRPRRGALAALTFLFPLLFGLLGSTSVTLMRYGNQQARRLADAERERLAAEVKLLKSQVNPHFLFNTLNNLYTLSLLKDERAPESLLRLSEMLRYMIYEADSPRVALHREIAYLRDYIALVRLKDSRGLAIDLNLDESRPDLPIAPLLLLPFVENAVKHGRLEDIEHGFLEIKLRTEPQKIFFQVRNNYTPGDLNKDATGGIGLANVRRRLELLYPDRHHFEVVGDGDVFTVRLSIQLS